ncbi:MAG TPA: TlpA disulfide reductase family protein [Blastocatellia bacterium]
MKSHLKNLGGLAAIIALLASASLQAVAGGESWEGRWDASVTINNVVVPFRLDIAGKGDKVTGTLYNGDQQQTTTSAKLENGSVTLNFEHYLTKIVAAVKDGKLEGKVLGRFERDKYIGDYPFQAKRYVAPAAADVAGAPSIGGLWEIPYESAKGEKAWRLIVKQKGAEVSASILRIDGDTGALTGTYRDGKFVVSHFDASRPLVLEIKANSDGSLSLRQEGAYAAKGALTAYRPEVARAKGLPEPASFTSHTTVRDPKEVFKFSFPDINGKLVSSTDERFKNNVIVAVVTGTWCPNCHDEAQYLVQLDKKYRDKGLAIVALDFEEPEQQEELTRAKAFVKKYGVEYPYLLAGAPAEMWEKVPQGVNLNTWPATFFIGRDGLVKKIHAGFAAPASGVYHQQLKEDFVATIERLLAEEVASNKKPSVKSEE